MSLNLSCCCGKWIELDLKEEYREVYATRCPHCKDIIVIWNVPYRVYGNLGPWRMPFPYSGNQKAADTIEQTLKAHGLYRESKKGRSHP